MPTTLVNRFIETLESESYIDVTILANEAYDDIIRNQAALASGNTKQIRELLEEVGTDKIPKTMEIFKVIENYFNSQSE